MGRRVFTTGTGTGTGGKDLVIMGAGTGGSLTQSGWETMGAKNIVARDGYVSLGIDSTTDSRPVYLGNSRLEIKGKWAKHTTLNKHTNFNKHTTLNKHTTHD